MIIGVPRMIVHCCYHKTSNLRIMRKYLAVQSKVKSRISRLHFCFTFPTLVSTYVHLVTATTGIWFWLPEKILAIGLSVHLLTNLFKCFTSYNKNDFR